MALVLHLGDSADLNFFHPIVRSLVCISTSEVFCLSLEDNVKLNNPSIDWMGSDDMVAWMKVM